MIRRVVPTQKWFDDPVSPFLMVGERRPLRLLLDHPTLTAGDGVEAIEDFGQLDDLEIWTTTDRGGPWLDIRLDEVHDDYIPVHITSSPTKRGLAAVWPASTYRTAAQKTAVAHSIDPGEAFRQLCVRQCAFDRRFDLLVSDSDYLQAEPFGSRGSVRRAQEALAIVGLLLRSRGFFRLSSDLSMNLGSFYLVASRELLPASWHWFSACVSSSKANGGQEMAKDGKPATLMELGQTVLERVDWALRARDRLQYQLQVPQNNDTADETAFYLDALLMQLSGAFDALARVVAGGLGVGGGSPSWRQDEWLGKVKNSFPGLAAVMKPKTAHRDALEMVSLPRNTIHSAAMQKIATSKGGVTAPIKNVVRIPHGTHGSRFLEAIRRNGGDEHWGVQSLWLEATAFDPGVFVERTLPAALVALNELMAAIPVELFPNIDLANVALGPPSGDKSGRGPWSEWTRGRIRQLLGVG